MRLLLALFSLVAAQGCTVSTECNFMTGEICFNGVCTTATGVWDTFQTSIAASLGITLANFNASLNVNIDATAAVSTVVEGQWATLQAQGTTTVNVATIALGTAAANTQNAALQVDAAAKIAIADLSAASANAFLAVKASASVVVATLQVSASASLSVGLAAVTGAAARTQATFNAITLAADSSFTVYGGSVTFPSTAAGVTVGAGAQIFAFGDAQLTGNVGSAEIRIEASGSAVAQSPRAEVSGTFTAGGNIAGAGSLQINSGGNLIIATSGSASVEATLNASISVVGGGVVSIRRRVRGWGNVAVAASGELSVAVAASASVVGPIKACAGIVTLELDAAASASTSGTILSYTRLDVVGVPTCQVRLRDASGSVTVLTTVNGQVGRRLLASGEATWGSNSLTYTRNNNSPANRAVFSLGLMVALIVSVFAARQ